MATEKSNQIKKADMVRMGDAQPIKDIPILLLLRNQIVPSFALYHTDGHYTIQGYFGIKPIDSDDLWLDISDLITN